MRKNAAKAVAKPGATNSLTLSIAATVIEPTFTAFKSLKHLDRVALQRGNHRLEVGYLKGGCCAKTVYAVLKKGVVERLEVAPCDDSEKASSKDFAAVFDIVAKRFAKQPAWEPLPIGDFIEQTLARRINIGTGAGCFWICIFSWCLFCCKPWVTNPPSPNPDCWIEGRASSLM